MEYSDVFFQGTYILKERQREFKNQMVAASYTAWQHLLTQVKDPPAWDKYLGGLGLGEAKAKATQNELAREAKRAMDNATRILNQQKGKNARG